MVGQKCGSVSLPRKRFRVSIPCTTISPRARYKDVENFNGRTQAQACIASLQDAGSTPHDVRCRKDTNVNSRQ